MIKLKEIFPDKTFEIDVLATNLPAINLYLKQDFVLIEEKDGFNAPEKPKPLVYTLKYCPM